jgi:hypothetical protein
MNHSEYVNSIGLSVIHLTGDRSERARLAPYGVYVNGLAADRFVAPPPPDLATVSFS